MQQLAREMNLSETVFVFPPRGGGHARIRIFTPARSSRSPGIPTLGTAFVLAAPLQLTEIRLETGSGHRPGRARAGGGADRLRPDGAADPDRRAVRGRGASCSTALGVERSELPVEVYDNGLAARVRRRSARRRRWRRCGRTCARLADAAGRARRQLLRRLGDAGGRRGCSRPAAGSPRIRRPARPRGRSRCTSPATAGSRSARRSRSRRASRSGDRRRSTRGWTGRPSNVERVAVGGSAVVVARGEFRLP